MGSSVSVVNRLWAEGSSTEFGLPSEPSESSLLLQQEWGPVGTEAPVMGLKRSKVEAYHSSHLTSTLIDAWNYTSLLPCASMLWCSFLRTEIKFSPSNLQRENNEA